MESAARETRARKGARLRDHDGPLLQFVKTKLREFRKNTARRVPFLAGASSPPAATALDTAPFAFGMEAAAPGPHGASDSELPSFRESVCMAKALASQRLGTGVRARRFEREMDATMHRACELHPETGFL